METTPAGHSEGKNPQKKKKFRVEISTSLGWLCLKCKGRGWGSCRSQCPCVDSVEYPRAEVGNSSGCAGAAALGKDLGRSRAEPDSSERARCFHHYGKNLVVPPCPEKHWRRKCPLELWSRLNIKNCAGPGSGKQQKWEERIFPDSSSNLKCEGALKSCSASPGIFPKSQSWRDRAWRWGPRGFFSPSPPSPSSLLPPPAAGAAPGMRSHTKPGAAEPWGCSAGAAKDTEHSQGLQIPVLPLNQLWFLNRSPQSQDPPKPLLPGSIPSLRFLLSQIQRGPRRLLSLILALGHGRYDVIKNQKYSKGRPGRRTEKSVRKWQQATPNPSDFLTNKLWEIKGDSRLVLFTWKYFFCFVLFLIDRAWSGQGGKHRGTRALLPPVPQVFLLEFQGSKIKIKAAV